MSEPVSFSVLLLEAGRLAGKRSFHWVFLLSISLLAALAYFLSSHIQFLSSTPETDSVAPWLEWTAQNKGVFASFFVFSLCFSFAQAFVRGPLILSLEQTLLKEIKESAKAPPSSPTRGTLVRGAWMSLLFEILYDASSFFLALALFLPVFVALQYNQSALSSLFEISGLLFLAFSVLFYFVREYALYYSLLGRLRTRSSIDLGYFLFRKNISASILFGALLLGLTFTFTFLFDSVMLWGASLFHGSFSFVVFFLFLFSGAFFVYREALRLLFFHNLASDKKKEEVPDAIVEGVPETPPVV